jgi:hypothetical protein
MGATRIEKKGVGSMLSRAAKQFLIWGGVLILVGVLSLVNQLVELSPWVWAAFLAGSGLGALGLYLADRCDGLVLLAAYVLWAVAGLIALVSSDLLRDEAIAVYVLLAMALPFLGIFLRDRGRWWALIPAYLLLVISGLIGLTQWRLFSDDLVSAYVLLAGAILFFMVYARDRARWWALIPGGILAVLGLSFATWLPWHSVRSSLIAGGAAGHVVALALLVVGFSLLVRAIVGRDRSGEAARSGSDGTIPSGLGAGEPPAA